MRVNYDVALLDGLTLNEVGLCLCFVDGDADNLVLLYRDKNGNYLSAVKSGANRCVLYCGRGLYLCGNDTFA